MAFFNPFRRSYIENPYPALARLRSEEPVHRSRELDAWVVTSYDTVRQDQGWIATIDWKLVVADEAQFIKNPTAGRTAARPASRRSRTLRALRRLFRRRNADGPHPGAERGL